MLVAVSPNSRDKPIGTTYSKNSPQSHNSFCISNLFSEINRVTEYFTYYLFLTIYYDNLNIIFPDGMTIVWGWERVIAISLATCEK